MYILSEVYTLIQSYSWYWN